MQGCHLFSKPDPQCQDPRFEKPKSLRPYNETKPGSLDRMPYQKLQTELQRSPRTWLVTGVAGFIGSNLLEKLLQLRQYVVGLDNFSTGHQENLDEVRSSLGQHGWERANIIEGD